jgi:hypothetical protein
MAGAARIWLPVCVALLIALPAKAVTKNWNDGTGNWSEPTNWTPAGVPGAGDIASIEFVDDVARTVTYDYTGPAIALSHVSIDLAGVGANSITLSMSANALTTNSGELIGSLGRGTLDHSGGTNTITANSLVLGGAGTSVGTYNLSGAGTLVATTDEVVGIAGFGNFNQSGGTNTITGAGNALILGSSPGTGNYTLTGGSLSVADFEYVGQVGTGVFNQSGGSNTTGALTIGDTATALGTYSLSGGTLTVTGGESIGAVATGNGTQSGGTFAQTGGIHNVASLTLGNNAGATGNYTLSSGTLVSSVSEIIGDSGTGSFSQSGGVHTSVGNMNIGANIGASGTYSQSGGATNAANIFVGGRSAGAGGAGVLSIGGSSSIMTVPGMIKVYNTPGTSLNLNGGTLNVTAINVGGLPSLFNWNSGTLHVTNDVAWDAGAAATSTGSIFGSSLSLGFNKNLKVTGNETFGGNGLFNLSVGSGTHAVTGGITLKPGGTLTTTNSSVMMYGSFTQAGGAISGTFRNTGNFIYQSGQITAQFINSGTVSFGSNLTISNSLQNEGSMTVGGGQTLTVNSTITNLGDFTVDGGTIGQSSSFTNAAGGTLTAHGTINPNVTNNGAMIVDGVLFLGSLTNNGILQGTGTLSYGSNIIQNNAGGVINATTPGGTLALNFTLANNPGATVNIGPTSTFSVSQGWTNSGIVNLQGAGARLSGGNFTNNGTLEGFGTVTAPLATSNNGVFRASGGQLTFTGPTIINSTQSQVQVLAGATAMYLQGMSSNSGTISLLGGTFDNNNRTLQNLGTINGHGTLRTSGLTNTPNRLISVGGGDMDVIGGVVNNGVVSIQSGRSAYFFGPVSGSGSFTGTGTAVFLASLSPGSSPASVSFAGGATLGGGTSLVMELGGTTPGSGYDRIQVAGELSIGGVLAVSLIGGFVPGAGNTFDILDWGILSGTFSSLQLPALPSTYAWDTSQLYASGVLSVVGVGISGDYNNNGIVDGADYVLWRKGGPLVNEVNTPGVVDSADYTEWRARIGNTSGSGVSIEGETTVVPEPHTSLFVMLALLVVVGSWRQPKRSGSIAR